MADRSVPMDAVRAAREQHEQGNILGGWSILSRAGDRYATAALGVLDGQSVPGSGIPGRLLKRLALFYWTILAGAKETTKRFPEFAFNVQGNYLELLDKSGGVLPSTAQIEKDLYIKATEAMGLPRVFAVDLFLNTLTQPVKIGGKTIIDPPDWAQVVKLARERIDVNSQNTVSLEEVFAFIDSRAEGDPDAFNSLTFDQLDSIKAGLTNYHLPYEPQYRLNRDLLGDPEEFQDLDMWWESQVRGLLRSNGAVQKLSAEDAEANPYRSIAPAIQRSWASVLFYAEARKKAARKLARQGVGVNGEEPESQPQPEMQTSIEVMDWIDRRSSARLIGRESNTAIFSP